MRACKRFGQSQRWHAKASSGDPVRRICADPQMQTPLKQGLGSTVGTHFAIAEVGRHLSRVAGLSCKPARQDFQTLLLCVQHHRPLVLANLPWSLKDQGFVYLLGAAEQEYREGLSPLNAFWLSLDAPDAQLSDLSDRTLKCGGWHSGAVMALAEERGR